MFNFQNAIDLHNWSEQSDTVRSAGRSKASFDLYKTSVKQSAIFFSLLNPLPNGACFAGVRTSTQLDLEGYQYISFTCKTTGNATIYKIILRHNHLDNEPHPTFEQKFKVCLNFRLPTNLYLMTQIRIYIHKKTTKMNIVHKCLHLVGHKNMDL